MKRALLCGLGVLICTSGAYGAFTDGIGTIWLEAADGSDTVMVGVGETAIINVFMTYEDGGDNWDHTMYGMDAALKTAGIGFQAIGFNPGGVPGPWGSAGDLPLHFGDHGPIDQDGDQVPDVAPAPGNLNTYQLAWGSDGQPDSNTSGLDAEPAGSTLTEYLVDTIVIEGLAVAAETVTFQNAYDSATPAFFDVYFGPPPPSQTWHNNEVNWTQGVGNELAGTPLFINVTPEPASLALLALGGLAAFRRRR